MISPETREKWRPRITVGVLALAAALFAVLVPLSIYLTSEANKAGSRADTAETRKDAVADAAEKPLATVEEQCRRNDANARKLQRDGKCLEAAEAREVIGRNRAPAPEPPTQVDSAIQAEVAEYFRRNPVQGGPSRQEVIELIAQIYARNPPADGRDGRSVSVARVLQMVIEQVNAYCANDACRGATGAMGATGPEPSSERLTALIITVHNAYCGQESAPCRGPIGNTGAAGRNGPVPTGHRFEEIEDDCRYLTTLRRADDTTYELNTDVPESFCSDAPNRVPTGPR